MNAIRARLSVARFVPPWPQTLAVGGDVAILVGAYVSLMLIDNHDDAIVRLTIWSSVLVTVWLGFALSQGAYRRSVLAHPLHSPYVIAKTTILSGAVFHLLPLVGGPLNSRVASIALVIALVGPLVAWRLLLSRLASCGAPLRDLVVVGAGWAGQTLAGALAANPAAPMRLVAFVDAEGRLASPGARMLGVPVYPAAELTSVVQRADGPARVVLAVTDQTHAAIYDQLTSLTESGVEVAAMTSVYEEVTGRIPVHNLGNSWWTVLPRPSTDLGYRTAKQLVDLIGVLVGLTLLAVVLPIVGPLLMRETRGSLFFTQIRIGRLGKPFKLIKLRTLADKDGGHPDLWDRKTANRPSRLGALIRATGIDELPQCLNVLKAEMSLVGPRPYVTEEVADFQRSIPFFKTRALVRPGITGWAQVNLGYGFSLDDEIGKLQYDLFYVGHQSFYLDLLIMARTVSLLFRRRRRRNSRLSPARGSRGSERSDLDDQRRARPGVLYRYDDVLAAAEAALAQEQPDLSFVTAVADLGALGLPMVVLAHQPSHGPGLAPTELVDPVLRRLRELAGPASELELEVCFCGHPAEGTECFGAGPNLLQEVGSELRLDLARSVFLSDRSADLAAALSLGARAVLLAPDDTVLPSAARAGVPRVATLADAVQLLRDDDVPFVRPLIAAEVGAMQGLDPRPAFQKLRMRPPTMDRAARHTSSDPRSAPPTSPRPSRHRRHHRSSWQRRLPDRRRVLSVLLFLVALVLVMFLVSSFLGALMAPISTA